VTRAAVRAAARQAHRVDAGAYSGRRKARRGGVGGAP